MSAAAAQPADQAPKKGKKKLIIIIAAVVLLLAAGGGAFLMMKKSAHADDEDGDAPVAHHAKADASAVPVFVPLDPFTVNLADRDTERYAQIGITLEVDDPKTGDRIKVFMPVIRNNVLMILAHKTTDEVRSEEGKHRLAAELRAEILRPLGYEVDPEDLMDGGHDADDAPKAKKKKRRTPALPVKAVHFSNFIVQ